ncbi:MULTISPECIES: hypothetical protein [Pseudanabaena]|uniref:Uncharacterized protein n=2 Tax=Pseudanabaena TaxID=1152 RepID=A0A9X4MAC3_9CYAN|nr:MULTISPECIES: hypothetical protein [Pseudanabaena]MDG3496926.1 hypothetical protein [Pseudanabaena catenata USMAC16]
MMESYMGTLTDIFVAQKEQRFDFLRENFSRIFCKYHQDRFAVKQGKLKPFTTFLDTQLSKPIDINVTAQFFKQHRVDAQSFVTTAINEAGKFNNVQIIGGVSPRSANLVRDLFADEDSLIVSISQDIVIEIIDFLCSDPHYPMLCNICFPCTSQVIVAAHKKRIPVSVRVIRPPLNFKFNRHRIIACANWDVLVQYASADVVLKLCSIPWLDEIPCFE